MRSGSCSLPMPAAVMHSAAGGQTGATIRPIPRKGVDSPHPRRCSSARAIPRRMRFLPRRAGRKPTACRKRSPALRTWSPARDQGPEVTPTGVAPLFRPDAPDRSTHAGCGKSRGQVAASPSVIGGPGHAPSRRCRWIAGDDDGARPDPTGSWAGPIRVAGGPRPDPADRGRARPDGGLVCQTPRPGGSLDGAARGRHAAWAPGRSGCRASSPGGGGGRRTRPGLLTSSTTRRLVPNPVVERRSIRDGSGSAGCLLSQPRPASARPGRTRAPAPDRAAARPQHKARAATITRKKVRLMQEGYTQLGSVLTDQRPEDSEGDGVIVVGRFKGDPYDGVQLSYDAGRRNLYLTPEAALRLAILLGAAVERDIDIR